MQSHQKEDFDNTLHTISVREDRPECKAAHGVTAKKKAAHLAKRGF
jgi:hypothetical protein